MSLIGRLIEPDVAGGRRKLALSHVVAGLRLMRSGRLTKARMVADLQLDAGEVTELDALITKLQASVAPRALIEDIEDILVLAERRLFNLDTEAKVATAINGLS